MYHPTIKFTTEYSKEEVNFLDLNIKSIDGELKTDLFVKPTDTHQFFDFLPSMSLLKRNTLQSSFKA